MEGGREEGRGLCGNSVSNALTKSEARDQAGGMDG